MKRLIPAASLVLLLGFGAFARLARTPKHPIITPNAHIKRVVIVGYDDDAMEPFISRDGQFLLFNNLNEPSVNTDIHFARRVDDFHWKYEGKVGGLNTPDLEGCPTLDKTGRMFFVSPRDYGQTLCTIYTAQFKAGQVTKIQMLDSISRKQPGQVNFDVEVSPNGKTLIFVDSQFKPGVGPQSSDLVIAAREVDVKGEIRFARSPDSDALLHQVNTTGLEYAPTISADGLTLYFTRFDADSGFDAPQIYRSTRRAVTDAFGAAVHLDGLGDFVEGSALSPDEKLLYFHRKDGARFHLYAVPTGSLRALK